MRGTRQNNSVEDDVLLEKLHCLRSTLCNGRSSFENIFSVLFLRFLPLAEERVQERRSPWQWSRFQLGGTMEGDAQSAGNQENSINLVSSRLQRG